MPDDVLSIEIPLILTWRTLPDTVSAPSLRQSNMLAFALLESFNEQPAATHETHHSSPDLQRIENKLNILIEMVSQLSGQSQQTQQSFVPVPVRLSSKGLEWLSDTAIDETALLLELRLDNEMPHALKIIAEVISVTAQGAQYRVRTHFTSMDETEENQLEKWIFTHHRRRVAQARSQNSTS